MPESLQIINWNVNDKLSFNGKSPTVIVHWICCFIRLCDSIYQIYHWQAMRLKPSLCWTFSLAKGSLFLSRSLRLTPYLACQSKLNKYAITQSIMTRWPSSMTLISIYWQWTLFCCVKAFASLIGMSTISFSSMWSNHLSHRICLYYGLITFSWVSSMTS